MASPVGVGGEYEKTRSATELSVYDTVVCMLSGGRGEMVRGRV
jgi:hypothetical protein